MARVQADADALRRPHGVQDRRQLLEASPDGRAAARGVLEQHRDAVPARPRRQLVERLRDALDARLETRALVRARMDDHEGQARAPRPARARRGTPRPPAFHSAAAGAARLIRYVACANTVRIPVSLHAAREAPDLLLRVRLGRPLELVLEEDLDHRAADLAPAQRARDRARRRWTCGPRAGQASSARDSILKIARRRDIRRARAGAAARPAEEPALERGQEGRGDLLRAPASPRVVPLVDPVQHAEQTEHDEARRHVAEDAALHALDHERLDALVVPVLLRRASARARRAGRFASSLKNTVRNERLAMTKRT